MWRLLAILAVLTGGTVLPPAAWSCQSQERYEPRTFLGYACEDDCERHKAGFAWAARRGAQQTAQCAALARPEAEGCRAYLQDRLTPVQAGFRWALENEIAAPWLCDGAGEGFRAGCLQYAAGP